MKKIVVLCGIFVLCVGGVYAINTQLEGFQIVKNTSQEIGVHGDCKKITNNSQFWDVFIPTRSVEEWNSVKNNSAASHLLMEDCITENQTMIIHRDEKWRVSSIEGWNRSTLRDGVYYKSFVFNLSEDDLNNMKSAKITTALFDDWMEIKANGSSVFSGPFPEFTDLLYCDENKKSILEAENIPPFDYGYTINISDMRPMDTKIPAITAANFMNRGHSISYWNDCNNDTGRHLEQYTSWAFYDGFSYFTRFPGYYYYPKDIFPNEWNYYVISANIPVYQAENIKHVFREGKNMISVTGFVWDTGNLLFSMTFEYHD